MPAATDPALRASRAARILDSTDRPPRRAAATALFLLSGLPGAGKSTFARALAARTGAVVLESDRLRALLFAAPVHSPRESALLFSAMRAAARVLLAEGRVVIIDATNLSESDRRPFYRLAQRSGVPLTVVALEAPVDVIESRLEQRLAQPNGYAFADAAVYHRMKGRVERISHPHLRIDTSDAAAFSEALDLVAAATGEAAGPGGGT